MSFKAVRKLDVYRMLSTNEKVWVGTLAQDREYIYFAYQTDYLANYGNLSPFKLKADGSLQIAPKEPFNKLHGVFADSLPDGWGLLLQDRFFRKLNIFPNQITTLDRLAFIGGRGIGALQFEPNYEPDMQDSSDLSNALDLAKLGLHAQEVFDGASDDVIKELVIAGSSGGARPKAQIFMPKQTDSKPHAIYRTQPKADDEAWIVKFTSKNLLLGHEEGLCEAVYLSMAQECGLNPVKWQLLPAPAKSGASYWLAVKRFDWVHSMQGGTSGRYHVHSLAGLLHADFRFPSLDYDDVIKASKLLCQSQEVGNLQFARAMFNLFAMNQDDHAKNWAFIQDDAGFWLPTPHYDITFSPNQYGEHATSFDGYGKNPPLKAIQKLAGRAGFDDWAKAKIVIEQIIDAISNFKSIAKNLGVRKNTIDRVDGQLSEIRKLNVF